MTREYLSSIDAALLQLDDPTNLMMITAVMVFKAPISFERLKATIESRLLNISRFRQRLAWSSIPLRIWNHFQCVRSTRFHC